MTSFTTQQGRASLGQRALGAFAPAENNRAQIDENLSGH
jgi:hypothetical protein